MSNLHEIIEYLYFGSCRFVTMDFIIEYNEHKLLLFVNDITKLEDDIVFKVLEATGSRINMKDYVVQFHHPVLNAYYDVKISDIRSRDKLLDDVLKDICRSQFYHLIRNCKRRKTRRMHT